MIKIWFPHIIAVMAFVVFIVLGLACATQPKTKMIVFDKNIPEEQCAILLVPGGHWEVFEFSGRKVKWFDYYSFNSNTVLVPSGKHFIKFYYYYGDGVNDFTVGLNAEFEAGHNYRLKEELQGSPLVPSHISWGVYDDTTGKYVSW